MTVIVGIDPSTYCGIVRVEGDEIVGKCINFPMERGYKRLQSIAREVRRTLEVWEPDIVVIEGYAIGHLSSAVSVIELGCVVRMHLYLTKRWWYTVAPTTLKKWTTGSGNAKKPLMAQASKLRWGYESPSDDIIDACCLAKLGEALVKDPTLKIKGVFTDGYNPPFQDQG